MAWRTKNHWVGAGVKGGAKAPARSGAQRRLAAPLDDGRRPWHYPIPGRRGAATLG